LLGASGLYLDRYCKSKDFILLSKMTTITKCHGFYTVNSNSDIIYGGTDGMVF